MGHNSQRVVTEARNTEYSLFLKPANECEVVRFDALHDTRFKGEPHDIGLDIDWVHDDTIDLRELLGHPLAVIIVLGKFFLPIGERDETTGCENTCLTHASTKHFTKVASSPDVFL